MNRRRRSLVGPRAGDGRLSLEPMLEPSAERSGGTFPTGDVTPDLTRSSVLEMTVDGKEATMSPSGPSDQSYESLTGSLAAFSLSDVLTLLASTGQTGELHAMGEDGEGWLWLTDGELANARVGSATTIGQAVFELACIHAGRFTFTSGVVSSSGHPTVPVAAVLQEVRPQVDEWRELRAVVPLEAEVNLAPSPPGQEIRIRNDQWHVLTTVGTSGLSVKSVLERIGGEQVAGLRTLRDLRAAGLIVVGGSGATEAGPPLPGPHEAGAAPTGTAPSDPPNQSVGLAEVAMMPPPIAVDPWAKPPSESDDPGGNGVA